jgi:hypothetical protein
VHLHHHLLPRQLAVPDAESVVSQPVGRRAIRESHARAVAGDGIGWLHPDHGFVRGGVGRAVCRAVCRRRLLQDLERP